MRFALARLSCTAGVIPLSIAVLPGHSNFITGAGGFLQNIVQGWAGVRIEADAMRIRRPTLPPTVTSIKIRSMQFRGVSFSVQFDANHISFVVAEAQHGMRQLMISAGSAEAQKLGTKPVVFSLAQQNTSFTIEMKRIGSGN